MDVLSESLAKGLANRVIRSVYVNSLRGIDLELDKNSRRKTRIRNVVKLCKKDDRFSLLAQNNVNKSKWEVVIGHWSSLYSYDKKEKGFSDIDCKSIAFCAYCDLNGFDELYKIGGMTLSNHALQRLIMRHPNKILDYNDLMLIISGWARKLILAGFELRRQNRAEGYVIINDYFIPIIVTPVCQCDNHSYSIIDNVKIKTVMPIEFEGAQRTINNEPAIVPELTFFDYIDELRLCAS